MKTPVTLLQEMMVKRGQAPEFECINQSGPAHEAQFTVQCRAGGATTLAVGRSKREAKHEAARLALQLLAAGDDGGDAAALPAPVPAPAAAPRTYVALLYELSDHLKLPPPEYIEISAEGPAHLRHFEWEARVASVTRRGAGHSKKAAKQRAAAELYNYLRDSLPTHTADFDEEVALARAHERAMERYSSVSGAGGCPAGGTLTMRVADFNTALANSIDSERRAAALAALDAAGEDAERGVREACEAMRVPLRAECLAPALSVLVLEAAPPLCVAGEGTAGAARSAVRLLRQLLRHPSQPPPPPLVEETLPSPPPSLSTMSPCY